MAAGDVLIQWDAAPTDMTVTNIASLADGDIWRSGEFNAADPSELFLKISYEIVFNATPVAGDYLRFWLAMGDKDSIGEIWPGDIATTEGKITAAGATAELEQSLSPVKVHHWVANHGTTFRGVFTLGLESWSPSWQLLMQPNGEALSASGHTVRYSYGHPNVAA